MTVSGRSLHSLCSVEMTEEGDWNYYLHHEHHRLTNSVRRNN